jgi:hypothetical protein
MTILFRNAIRIRVLDVAELKPDQWYLDMHRGNYKPDYPMAGIIEILGDGDMWVQVKVVGPPTSKEELTHTLFGTLK